MNDEKPIFSVVIPCLNEAPSLPGCLQEIRQAADALHLPYEIIVADNNSTDNIAQIAREHGARVVPVDQRGYGCARNAGTLPMRTALIRFVIWPALLRRFLTTKPIWCWATA